MLLDYFASLWFSSLAKANGEILTEKKAKLLDYPENTYAFVLRNSDATKPRSSFTLGRVIKTTTDEVTVETDFLVNEDAEIQKITDLEEIRGIRLTTH